MKKSLVIISFTLLFVSLAIAQEQSQKNPVQKEVNPNAPEITFEKVVHDYGVIEYGGDGKCIFKFTNTGKEPLILSRPRSSCGCTVPTYPRQPILPGKSQVITIVYQTTRVGTINKTVTVLSNAKNNPVVLRIKGKVNPKSN